MRKLVLISVAALALSSAAYADTVQITSVTELNTPSQTITSTGTASFKGPTTVTFNIFGKTCKWVGSASGSVPGGCNYGITANATHETLSNPASGPNTGGNNVCTPASQMLANCH